MLSWTFLDSFFPIILKEGVLSGTFRNACILTVHAERTCLLFVFAWLCRCGISNISSIQVLVVLLGISLVIFLSGSVTRSKVLLSLVVISSVGFRIEFFDSAWVERASLIIAILNWFLALMKDLQTLLLASVCTTRLTWHWSIGSVLAISLLVVNLVLKVLLVTVDSSIGVFSLVLKFRLNLILIDLGFSSKSSSSKLWSGNYWHSLELHLRGSSSCQSLT